MSNFVLDASALLAYLREEPGTETVENAFVRGVYISIVNWAEVISKIAELGENPEVLIRTLENENLLGNRLQILPFTEEDALAVARLRPLTRSAGLSLGDRACIALARRLELPILTCDRTWASLSLSVVVNLIR